ncbi:MAG: helix-turn-helix transcriptional regulator [Chloroflexi bacterium]|nr:helix-turn-helix transcriptional regulator [Chloroflexota bacterium]
MSQALNKYAKSLNGPDIGDNSPDPTIMAPVSIPQSKEPFEGESNGETRHVTFSAGKPRNDWQIFTSHGLVLISVLNNPGRTVREIGLELNLTDRAVAIALADLVAEGYMTRERVGRRTFYHVNEEHLLRYPVSPFGIKIKPILTVKALRAENLATHAPALNQ